MATADTRTPPQTHGVDKLYIENTLLRVAGAHFCHDAKRAPTHTNEIQLSRADPDKTITIRPDPELGQPGPLAHKVFVALIKKHSGYGRPIQHEISFTRREIGRLIGRHVWGGRDSEQLSRALHEIHHTFIKAHFKSNAGRHIEHSFNIFPEVRIERREFPTDPIETCTVTLADPIVTSLRDEHFTCLNHALMARLGTIGQALYMRLFFHFANLYDGRNAKGLLLMKRYDDVCTEWLGGLTVLPHRSKIIGEQLGLHLDQLVAEGFLASFGVDTAKSRDGFVLTFRPGRSFFDDYDRFYRRRRQGDLQFEFHDEKRGIGEPLRVAYIFAEKKTGQPASSISFVPTKDVETAKQLLSALSIDEMPSFIDYALAEARKTNFDVRTLGGLKQYVVGYVSQRQHHSALQAQQAAREQAEAVNSRYTAYMAAEAMRVYEALPADEQEAIRGHASRKAAGFSGTLGSRMTDYYVARITAERHGAGIKTFDQWSSTQHLGEGSDRKSVGFDRTECGL